MTVFGTLFPSFGETLGAWWAWAAKWYWLGIAAVFSFALWRMHWRTRFARKMKQTFDLTQLYVRPKKEKQFPQLLSLSDREDELYYVFRYRLRPGMSVSQFEDKKKWIEAAFHAETLIFGKGGIVTIKVKKEPYPIAPKD